MISPGYVEIWEAFVTLGFMVILVVVAYSCDKSHSRSESMEEQKKEEERKIIKTAIRILDKKFGKKAMIEVG